MKTPLIPHETCKRLAALACALAVFCHASGQAQTLQVVTKSVEKTFVFGKIKRISISAERADVEVSTWDRPEIKITVDLVAKHPDRTVATNDLDYFKHLIEASGNTVYARNYVLLPKGAAKPQANLKARYRLVVPASGAVTIQNNFGKVLIDGLSQETTVKADFCAVVLQNLVGKIAVDARFGTLRAENVDGDLALTTDRSDCHLKNIKGQCRIRAEYGNIEIETDKTLVKMDVKINQTTLKYVSALTSKTQ